MMKMKTIGGNYSSRTVVTRHTKPGFIRHRMFVFRTRAPDPERPTKTGIEGKKFGRRHELKFGRAFSACAAPILFRLIENYWNSAYGLEQVTGCQRHAERERERECVYGRRRVHRRNAFGDLQFPVDYSPCRGLIKMHDAHSAQRGLIRVTGRGIDRPRARGFWHPRKQWQPSLTFPFLEPPLLSPSPLSSSLDDQRPTCGQLRAPFIRLVSSKAWLFNRVHVPRGCIAVHCRCCWMNRHSADVRNTVLITNWRGCGLARFLRWNAAAGNDQWAGSGGEGGGERWNRERRHDVSK